MAKSASLLQAAIIIAWIILIGSSVAVSGQEDLESPVIWPTQHSPAQSPASPQAEAPPRKDSFTAPSFLGPILLNLGFQELAMAVHSLPSIPAWSGPSTIFAPTDASIQSCAACSAPRLLQEHIIPGLFLLHYLKSLPFGTKIETMVPGRCATVTSADNGTRIYIGGVEIAHPDLFNNGFVVVHGLEGFVSHLSPFSCNVERVSALSFPSTVPRNQSPAVPDRTAQPMPSFSVMRLMLRDAMLRLRISGYSILSLALRVKYAELVGLHNMTIFALDDISIFNGGHVYVREVRFHIVPNRMLMAGDLERLPPATVLPTLEPGEALVVTGAPVDGGTSLRINYVRIRFPDLVHNLRIVVHGLFMPFPHLNPTSEVFGSENGRSSGLQGAGEALNVQSCSTSEMDGGCGITPTPGMKLTAEIEDHHGL